MQVADAGGWRSHAGSIAHPGERRNCEMAVNAVGEDSAGALEMCAQFRIAAQFDALAANQSSFTPGSVGTNGSPVHSSINLDRIAQRPWRPPGGEFRP